MEVLKKITVARGATAVVRTAAGNDAESLELAPADAVFIFGWTGGPEKTIERLYGEKYSALGMHVVTIAAPLPLLWAGEATRHYTAVAEHPIYRKLLSLNRKIMIHVFSNGGLMNLWHLLRVTRGTPFDFCPRVSLQFFDSAPIISGIKSHAEFILSTTLRPEDRTAWLTLKAYATSVPWYFASQAVHRFWDLKDVIGMTKGKEEELPHGYAVRSVFLGKENPWTNLKAAKFLFSDGDKMTDPEGVAGMLRDYRVRFIAEKRDVRVGAKRWKDSPHVAHARSHPEEYWMEIGKSMLDAGWDEVGVILVGTVGLPRESARL